MWHITDASQTAGLTAVWSVGDRSSDAGVWRCEVTRNGGGVTMGGGADVRLRVEPVGQDRFSPVSEQYVCGDAWHVEFPQGENAFSLKMTLRMVETGSGHAILEPTFSIQTSLLDSRPMIDLVVDGERRQVSDDVVVGSPAVNRIVRENHETIVLLGRADAPFTTDLTHPGDPTRPGQSRLRLFGEFLEKGVIRKARPWLILTATTETIDEAAVGEIWQRLQSTPPPLTA